MTGVQTCALPILPPPLISASLKAGRIDGFCVGEPWNSVAVDEGHGVIVATKSELWNLSPEKVLMLRRTFADDNKNLTAALIRCLAQACVWIDDAGNKARLAGWLSQPGYVGVRPDILLQALNDDVQRGHAGLPRPAGNMLIFSRHHANFPWRSHARWLLTQMVRWGQVRAPFDICDVADAVYRSDLYRAASGELGLSAPDIDFKPEGGGAFFGAEVFDPYDPVTYISQHRVRRTEIDPGLFAHKD